MSSSELSCAAAAAAETWIGCHTLAYCLVELTPIALPPPRKWPVEAHVPAVQAAHVLDLHTARRGLNHIDSGVDHQGGRPCEGRVQTDERVLDAVPSIVPGFDLNPIKSSRK